MSYFAVCYCFKFVANQLMMKINIQLRRIDLAPGPLEECQQRALVELALAVEALQLQQPHELAECAGIVALEKRGEARVKGQAVGHGSRRSLRDYRKEIDHRNESSMARS